MSYSIVNPMGCFFLKMGMAIVRFLLAVTPGEVSIETTPPRKQKQVVVQFRGEFGRWVVRYTIQGSDRSFSALRRSDTTLTDEASSLSMETMPQQISLPLTDALSLDDPRGNAFQP